MSWPSCRPRCNARSSWRRNAGRSSSSTCAPAFPRRSWGARCRRCSSSSSSRCSRPFRGRCSSSSPTSTYSRRREGRSSLRGSFSRFSPVQVGPHGRGKMRPVRVGWSRRRRTSRRRLGGPAYRRGRSLWRGAKEQEAIPKSGHRDRLKEILRGRAPIGPLNASQPMVSQPFAGHFLFR